MERRERPASTTLNLRNFPLDLKHELRQIQLDRERDGAGAHNSLTDIVIEGLQFWLTHSGHAVSQEGAEKEVPLDRRQSARGE